MLHRIKAPKCYTDLGSKTVVTPPVNGKIQGFLKAFACVFFSSTFQGKFNFQWHFKTVLYIQVLFKPVRSLQKRQNNMVFNDIYILFEYNFKKCC